MFSRVVRGPFSRPLLSLSPLSTSFFPFSAPSSRSRLLTTTTPISPISPISPPSSPLCVLLILDGWGYRESLSHNAPLLASTPNFTSLFGHYSQLGCVSFLDASEGSVGLPPGQIGNSEVGHMNIGAGRVVYQDIGTINNSVSSGTISSRPALLSHIAKLKSTGGTCHVMGCLSPGGVHALQSHISTLANIVSRSGVPVVVHGFTDGRDVPPRDAASTLPEFMDSLDYPDVKFGTITGRYYALDRDNRWDRVGECYDVIMHGITNVPEVGDPVEAVAQAYGSELGDEFVRPTVIKGYEGVRDGDGILMCNFRADRAREILSALAGPSPPTELGIGDRRLPRPKLADAAGMVNYSDDHNSYMSSLFPPKDIANTLGEVVSTHGLAQLRAAETEKYPHVTFFLNGGREDPYPGEDRILVPSPNVATYDLQPSMSAPELTRRVADALDGGRHHLAVVNFANPDMVGHTGSLTAAVEACEAVDVGIGVIRDAVERRGGTIIVTADHGNAEKMWEEETGVPHTAHTLNKVPCILADYSDPATPHRRIRSGKLADIAPTILEILGVPIPGEMTGRSLIVDEDEVGALRDGPRMTRPPVEGSEEAGSLGRWEGNGNGNGDGGVESGKGGE